MNRPSDTNPQAKADSIDDLVSNIRQARTAADEADAIRKLHGYESAHGLTYTVQTTRAADGMVVQSPSVHGEPVVAHVTVFQGREVVRRFSFIPKDNANLALLGS